jgi:hypothetical protein
MKKLLLLTFLLCTAPLFSQWNSNWIGSYTILGTSDTPFNQFTTVKVDSNILSIQLDGIDLHRYEWVANETDSSFLVKCILSNGQTPKKEELNMRFLIQLEELADIITVFIQYKATQQILNLQRL